MARTKATRLARRARKRNTKKKSCTKKKYEVNSSSDVRAVPPTPEKLALLHLRNNLRKRIQERLHAKHRTLGASKHKEDGLFVII